jgi:nucleoid DNA-binding protein
MREIPLKTCPACGGDWFREADYYRFLREERVNSICPTWPNMVGQLSMAPMTLLVCLCGTPLRPEIGGVRGGYTSNRELMQFLGGLENSHAWLTDHYDGDLVLAAAEAYLANMESIQALTDHLKALERRAGLRIAQQTPSRKSPRGRYWATPKRKPASGDVLTLDTLVIALQEIGLTARVARKAVKAIFEGITNWLKDGGIAETPLGVFKSVRRPAESEFFRLGRSCKFNTQRKRVVFRPSPGLQAACNRSIPTEVPVPKVNIQPIHPNQLQCEKCGSSHFVEGHFKQYRQYYSASPGADISPITEDPVRALVCTCGHPIPPGQLRSYRCDDTSFRRSLEAARQYRERTNPEAILRRIVEPYATRSQHDELVERINKLETILNEPLPPSPRQPSKP